MKPQEQLARLIEATYGKAERSKFSGFAATEEQITDIRQIGRMILEHSTPMPCACTYLTATWVVMLRKALKLPVYCVVGDLRVRGTWAFRTSGDLKRQLEQSSEAWDGHCWAVIGNQIGDISLRLTALARPEGSNLREAVLDKFGTGTGLLIGKRGRFADIGFEYTGKYVASDQQLFALAGSAAEAGFISVPQRADCAAGGG